MENTLGSDLYDNAKEEALGKATIKPSSCAYKSNYGNAVRLAQGSPSLVSYYEVVHWPCAWPTHNPSSDTLSGCEATYYIATCKKVSHMPDNSEELKVFISNRESVCDECKEHLGRQAWIFLNLEKGALCLSCADLDHLEFLPSGNMALTRRTKKYSPLYAVVLKWSGARKHYERQGLLVQKEALEKAEEECLKTKIFVNKEDCGNRRGENKPIRSTSTNSLNVSVSFILNALAGRKVKLTNMPVRNTVGEWVECLRQIIGWHRYKAGSDCTYPSCYDQLR